MKVTIPLTEAEANIWNWAQDAAREFWDDDWGRDDGLHFDSCPVSVAQEGSAEIELHTAVIYRIGDQLVGMARERGGIDVQGCADRERMKALGDIPVANRIVKKLEEMAVKTKCFADRPHRQPVESETSGPRPSCQ